VINYREGQQVENGALPLPIDIVMHESVPMNLGDGTRLYADIFLPSRFQDLEAFAEKPIPALVAWYG
jgi:predicted acyl esterase